jgi:hypothetical protein
VLVEGAASGYTRLRDITSPSRKSLIELMWHEWIRLVSGAVSDAEFETLGDPQTVAVADAFIEKLMRLSD